MKLFAVLLFYIFVILAIFMCLTCPNISLQMVANSCSKWSKLLIDFLAIEVAANNFCYFFLIVDSNLYLSVMYFFYFILLGSKLNTKMHTMYTQHYHINYLTRSGGRYNRIVFDWCLDRGPQNG